MECSCSRGDDAEIVDVDEPDAEEHTAYVHVVCNVGAG